MATTASKSLNIDPNNVTKLSPQAEKNVANFVRSILAHHQNFTTFQNKLDAIDVAYARYQQEESDGESNGVDRSKAAEIACDVFSTDKITPPIVMAQVDSYIAYLAEVFCSGNPIFPVVSTPAKRIWADQLETLIDDHAQIGGYARQILMFLRDAGKYNFAGIEVVWDEIPQFNVAADFNTGTGKSINRTAKSFTRLRRLNPRNIIRDISVLPGDVSAEGDFVGYVEMVSKTKLKRMLNTLTNKRKAMNVTQAMNSGSSSATSMPSQAYRQDPVISEYVSDPHRTNGVDWNSWFDGVQKNGARGPAYGTQYELVTMYARIMPADFGISAAQPNTPQIWKFQMVNNQWVVCADRIISAYDTLPILIGQPIEDGLAYQTKSVAEAAIPFQQGAETLLNIRFAAARRAVSDRALYRADMISPKDINSKAAAPKIPVTITPLSSAGLEQAYKQIPFDLRGTETAVQDAMVIAGFSKDLGGLNNPRQGQFQKGNKSVVEWNDTMSGSDGRLRLGALTLELQVFSPMKSMMTLNIFQYGDDAMVVSQKTGEVLDIKLDILRKQVLAFRMADGYTPKSKLMASDSLQAIMQMIAQSPLLQQRYGTSLPGMLAFLADGMGVKNLEQFDPVYVAQMQQAQAGQQSANLQQNTLQDPIQQPGAPGAALPVVPAGQVALPAAGAAQPPTQAAPGIQASLP